MFGHKKGAFTDAHTDRDGRFKNAEKGTIFLDEIGELDLSCQVKLLRVLQEQTYEMLGDSKVYNADVRVICATNKNLLKLIEKGDFVSLTKWLDRLTAHDLSRCDLTSCELIDDWLQ